MNELAWRRREARLFEAHAAADPPLSPTLWRGVEARLSRPPRRRGVWLAVAVAVVAASVALWCLPGESPAPVVSVPPPVSTLAPPASAPPPAPEPAPVVVPPAAPAIVLNQVLETSGQVTVVISADAGRLEVEPCRGRFVNVTVLDSPHQRLELAVRDRRVEVRFDGGAVMASGVAHILVPADTHLILSTRSGPVVVRGLGGPLRIDTASGEVQVDSAPRRAPDIAITTDSGAITWRGLCRERCRVDARSSSGDIFLRTPHPAAFASGAIRATSDTGHIHHEEIKCSDPQCLSSPLPWRQGAPGVH